MAQLQVETRKCKICGIEKPIVEFRHRRNPRCRLGYSVESYCKPCEREDNKKRSKHRYETKGKQEFAEMYADPKRREEWLSKSKNWRLSNKEYLLEYRSQRRDEDRKNQREWRREKLANSPVHRLRAMVSNAVKRGIKRMGFKKDGSILDHLPYTMDELREHIEAQFEPWMSWDNHGRYCKEDWDENDPSTWTWQLDHVMPHSDLPYDSMAHPNFLRCWDLQNLRPLRAKDNLEDGTRRVRHKGA